MIIWITGTNGAGKNTIADYLVKKWFIHFGTRDILIPEIQSRNMEVTRDNMRIVANDLREKYGPDILAKRLCKLAEQSWKNAAIESFRTLWEIKELKKYPNAFLRGINADQKTRYQRIQERKDKDSDDVSFEEFSLEEDREYNNIDPTKANLKKCFEIADIKFYNNWEISDLYNKIENILNNLDF